MTESAHAPEHLNPDTVELYFSGGAPVSLVLDSRLGARLELDPIHEEVRLLVPAAGTLPEVTNYENLSIAPVTILGTNGEWFQLTIRARGMHYEACVLAESIVDRLSDGASMHVSVIESLAGLKGLLATRSRLSDEKVTGLIGELLLLKHLIDHEGENAAIQAWLGPLGVSHDFGFADFDAEVKTTQSPNRVHVIGSESQLECVPDRALYLVSIQLILAGAATEGYTLPELIESTRAALSASAQRSFDSALKGLGWHPEDHDLYRARYQLRNQPKAYLVDDVFPAITGEGLDAAIPGPNRPLVSAVSYRIDVTSLTEASAPTPLAGFCTTGGASND
ncbi:MAG: PD-(D/E)XK motif protein [Microbacteriaceae bacterium]